jgi:hypothetical protein
VTTHHTHAGELTRREYAARQAAYEAAMDQMQAEVHRTRAELAAYHAACESTDLEGDVRDALADLAEWETEDRCAPDWLVDTVIGLLAPLKAERDRLVEFVDQVRNLTGGEASDG